MLKKAPFLPAIQFEEICRQLSRIKQNLVKFSSTVACNFSKILSIPELNIICNIKLNVMLLNNIKQKFCPILSNVVQFCPILSNFVILILQFSKFQTLTRFGDFGTHNPKAMVKDKVNISN